MQKTKRFTMLWRFLHIAQALAPRLRMNRDASLLVVKLTCASF